MASSLEPTMAATEEEEKAEDETKEDEEEADRAECSSLVQGILAS